jgi:cysteine desulfurase / selenocysteine lyase
LVAYTWGNSNIKKGNKVILTEYEHHSNIVPWQTLCHNKGAKVKYLEVDDDGYISLEDLEVLISQKGGGKTKMIALSEMSNVLGTIFPAREIIKLAHEKEIPVLLDGAQSVPHMKTDVQQNDCDFLAFSAHKMLGPTGVGILYVKREILEDMKPFILGGDMIKEVHKENTIFNDLPYRFEGGTPNIADVIGFSAAIDYLNRIGMENVREHEHKISLLT